MNNKSLFAAIALTVALFFTYSFYNNKVETLSQEITQITEEYNTKLGMLNGHVTADQQNTAADMPALERLNKQLIETREQLHQAQQQLRQRTSTSSVLSHEIQQSESARDEVKALKGSLESAQTQLKLSGEKVQLLQDLFKAQHTEQANKTLTRIATLKETSTGIAVSGLIVPMVGAATLAAYAIEEIDNYCQNIESILSLEKQVFGQVVSLDENMQQAYHQQCVVSLEDKIKDRIKTEVEQLKQKAAQ